MAFETTLNLPDSLFRVAFQLFDQDGSGTIGIENFKNLMQHVDRRLVAFNFLVFNFTLLNFPVLLLCLFFKSASFIRLFKY